VSDRPRWVEYGCLDDEKPWFVMLRARELEAYTLLCQLWELEVVDPLLWTRVCDEIGRVREAQHAMAMDLVARHDREPLRRLGEGLRAVGAALEHATRRSTT
jgi:hypothetical protein